MWSGRQRYERSDRAPIDGDQQAFPRLDAPQYRGRPVAQLADGDLVGRDLDGGSSATRAALHRRRPRGARAARRCAHVDARTHAAAEPAHVLVDEVDLDLPRAG